jgi:hypothetical protein
LSAPLPRCQFTTATRGAGAHCLRRSALSVHNRNPRGAGAHCLRRWPRPFAEFTTATRNPRGAGAHCLRRWPPPGSRSWGKLCNRTTAARRWGAGRKSWPPGSRTLAARFAAALIMLAARRWGATAASSAPALAPARGQPAELAASSAEQPPRRWGAGRKSWPPAPRSWPPAAGRAQICRKRRRCRASADAAQAGDPGYSGYADSADYSDSRDYAGWPVVGVVPALSNGRSNPYKSNGREIRYENAGFGIPASSCLTWPPAGRHLKENDRFL